MFRPCIDLRQGKVVQIVGGTLTDAGQGTHTNFESDKSPAWFADLYRRDALAGGPGQTSENVGKGVVDITNVIRHFATLTHMQNFNAIAKSA